MNQSQSATAVSQANLSRLPVTEPAYAVLDRRGQIIELDTLFATLLGGDSETLLGQPLTAFWPTLAAALATVLATGNPEGTSLQLQADRTLMLQLNALRSSWGAICGIEVVITPPDASHLPPQPELELLSIRSLIDSLFAFVGVMLPDGTLIEANRAALVAAGLQPEDVLGKPVEATYWWTHDPQVQHELRAAITRAAEGHTSRYDVLIQLAPDRFTTIDFMLAPIFNTQGQVQYLIPSAMDIGERKRTEAILASRERHLRLALDAAQMGSWEIDATGSWLLRSEHTDEIFGFKPQHGPRPANDYWERIHPDDQEMVREAFRRTMLEGLEHKIEYRIFWPDGSIHWIASRGDQVQDAPGSIFGVLIDITDRRMAEAEREELLHREQESRAAATRTATRLAQLQEVTAALSEALLPEQVAEVIINYALRTLGANAAAVRLLNTEQQSLELIQSHGFSAEVVAQWRHIPLESDTPVAEVARTGEPLFFPEQHIAVERYPLIRSMTEPLGVQASAIIPLGIEGRTLGTLALTFNQPVELAHEDRDVLLVMATLGAQAIERARLYAAAHEAVEVRDNFIAIAAHDLRAPLAVLLGQTQLLERRATQEQVAETVLRRLGVIAEQTRRLNRMIGAVLDLSHIQSGQLSLVRVPLDLAVLAARTVAEIRPTLARHILAYTGLSSGLPILGDEVRLEQVLYNLIGNAVKYSPNGGTITVHVTARDDQASIMVTDQGIGVPLDAQAKLFDRFYRAPNASFYGISGQGIGLYAVRRIITLHGGTISLQSEEHVGSSFTMTLPLAPSSL
ncbi:MAG: ATP-binding protein [Oscillochloridaceae bacterium umkhey_bin13]